MQYDVIHSKYNKYYKYNTITIQFNRIQCDTILYIYHHIYYHIFCMYISIYIYIYPVPYPEVITAPADRLATSPQAKFWSFWGRMGLARQELNGGFRPVTMWR